MRRFRTLEVLAFCACVACIGIVAANGSSKFWVPQNYAFCTSRLPIEREAVKLSRQFAVVLRGESFRNWGYRGANATCCNGTDIVQRNIFNKHALLFEELRALGWNVSVFISTYRCTNGQLLVESSLPQWYRPWLQGFRLNDRSTTNQNGNLGSALAMLNETGVAYAHLLIMRLDLQPRPARPSMGSEGRIVDPCFLEVQHPLDNRFFTGSGNKDNLYYIPGAYLPCLMREYLNLNRFLDNSEKRNWPGHEIGNDLMRLSGEVPAASMRSKDHNACRNSTRKSIIICQKETGQSFWEKVRIPLPEKVAGIRGCACPSTLVSELEIDPAVDVCKKLELQRL